MRAREMFEQCRDACERIEELTFAIDNGGGQRKGEPTHGGGISDPTASRAIYLAEKMPELIAERDELTAYVGECMRLVNGICIAFTQEYAACVEMRYIDCMNVCDIADELGISPGTVRNRISTAFDYIDAVGLHRAALGIGIAE